MLEPGIYILARVELRGCGEGRNSKEDKDA